MAQPQQQSQSAPQPAAAADALSYIDKDYDDPRMKQVVHSLIEEEMAAFEPPDYLEDKPAPKMRFPSPLLKAEWARVRAGKAMDTMDTSRYELQPPQGAAAEDETAWRRALNNARAQTEHQHNRYLVFYLFQEGGECTSRNRLSLCVINSTTALCSTLLVKRSCCTSARIRVHTIDIFGPRYS